MPKVLSTPLANRDLLEIGLHIAQESPRAADKILTTIGQKCEMLAHSPRLGRKRDELAHGLRSFPVGSYVIFYRVAHNGVEIIRVLHGARDIELADES